MVENFLNALPLAAKSPLAFCAYLLTLFAWFLIAWRVKRYRILLRYLKSLPARDRLAAIKAEIGAIEIKDGLTAEQWLKSRIHIFYFSGFCVVCVTILAIVALTVYIRLGSVSGTIGLGG
jgi:hypothetical protein